MVGVIGFARAVGMSYASSRIGLSLIPDTSKPTVTWGRKAVGLPCRSPCQGEDGCQVAEGILSCFGTRFGADSAPPRFLRAVFPRRRDSRSKHLKTAWRR